MVGRARRCHMFYLWRRLYWHRFRNILPAVVAAQRLLIGLMPAVPQSFAVERILLSFPVQFGNDRRLDDVGRRCEFWMHAIEFRQTMCEGIETACFAWKCGVYASMLHVPRWDGMKGWVPVTLMRVWMPSAAVPIMMHPNPMMPPIEIVAQPDAPAKADAPRKERRPGIVGFTY